MRGAIARAIGIVAMLAWLPTAAMAQVLYKWVDENGKTQYSDRVPKGFKGAVTRIEPDAAPAAAAAATSLVRPDKAPEARDSETAAKEAPTDLAAKRRALRAQLQAAIDRARDKVDAARTALEKNGDPEVDERQVIQRSFAAGAAPLQRANCRSGVGSDGKAMVMCPALVLKPEYHERIRALEQDLAQAEAELHAAEVAYRRGVD